MAAYASIFCTSLTGVPLTQSLGYKADDYSTHAHQVSNAGAKPDPSQGNISTALPHLRRSADMQVSLCMASRSAASVAGVGVAGGCRHLLA